MGGGGWLPAGHPAWSVMGRPGPRSSLCVGHGGGEETAAWIGRLDVRNKRPVGGSVLSSQQFGWCRFGLWFPQRELTSFDLELTCFGLWFPQRELTDRKSVV